MKPAKLQSRERKRDEERSRRKRDLREKEKAQQAERQGFAREGESARLK